MLAMDSSAPRFTSPYALSLTTIASKLAPAGIALPVFHQPSLRGTILCSLRHAAGGMSNWETNQRVNELGME